KPVMTEKQITAMIRLAEKMDGAVAKVAGVLTSLQERASVAQKFGDDLVAGVRLMEAAVRAAKSPSVVAPARVLPGATRPVQPPIIRRERAPVPEEAKGLTAAQRRLLSAAAWWEHIGVTSPSR